jgi:hypothetical protein
MMDGVARQWTGALESNFNEFWDSTFGYANSLLEQLLKMTFTSILGDLLSFLPGGGILGGILSIFDKPARGGGTPSQTIVIRLGEEELATLVRQGNETNRLRRMN